MKVASVLFFILSFSASLRAETLITKVTIIGATRTDEEVIRTELDLHPPQVVSEAELRNSIQRVWNLNLFVRVKDELRPAKAGAELVVTVEDRWTMVPIAKFGGGGGVSYYVLGVYDPNVAGKYIELGTQYENLGGRNSFVGWFRRPQFLGDRRARLGGDIWSVSRNRLFFDRSREETGGFTMNRRRAHLFYDYFVTDFFRPGIALDLQQDETGEGGLTDDTKEKNARSGRDVSGKENFSFIRLYTTVGRQDLEEELVRGWSWTPSIQYQLDRSGERDRLFVFRQDFLAAVGLPGRKNFAYRFSHGHISRSSLSQLNYIGGLEHVRGFLDSQFPARNFAFQNLEWRFPWRYSTRFTLQQAIFHDAAWIGGDQGKFGVHSAGTGLRFIFPKIYRLNLRLDYGVSLGKFPGANVSFGLQQLF